MSETNDKLTATTTSPTTNIYQFNFLTKKNALIENDFTYIDDEVTENVRPNGNATCQVIAGSATTTATPKEYSNCDANRQQWRLEEAPIQRLSTSDMANMTTLTSSSSAGVGAGAPIECGPVMNGSRPGNGNFHPYGRHTLANQIDNEFQTENKCDDQCDKDVVDDRVMAATNADDHGGDGTGPGPVALSSPSSSLDDKCKSGCTGSAPSSTCTNNSANDKTFNLCENNNVSECVGGKSNNREFGQIIVTCVEDIMGLGADEEDEEDPYFELQAYLERVKQEINQVFEQYQAQQNDELPRCTASDSDTSRNKLPSHETSCFTNGSAGDIQPWMMPRPDGLGSRGGSGPPPPPRRHHRLASSAAVKVMASMTTDDDAAAADDDDDDDGATKLLPMNTYGQYARPKPFGTAQFQSQPTPATLESANSITHESTSSSSSSDDVNIWANKFLKELDNLMGSDKQCSVKLAKEHVVAATQRTAAAINARNNIQNSILKPEKHTTIPLQSFNLDCSPVVVGRLDNCKHPNISRGDLIKMSANGGQQRLHRITSNFIPNTLETTLKIEENDLGLGLDQHQHQIQEEGDGETIKTSLLNMRKDKMYQTSPLLLLSGGGGGCGGGGDSSSKKGSTSTIWTSEESILRSVGAVDEDNKSSSSSACEEANGVLSSGKSGISLDSSGLEMDNIESGIGTATPPKEMSSWKLLPCSDSESICDPLRKFHLAAKSGGGGGSMAATASDDPDLLEILSLCEEANREYEEEEGLRDDCLLDVDDDDFDCCDVVLREKSSHNNLQLSTTDDDENNDTTVCPRVTFSRAHKCRSHSLESTPQLPYKFIDLNRSTKMATAGGGGGGAGGGCGKDKAAMCLSLRQEPFQSIMTTTHFHELPSPSSASLHSAHESLCMQELTTKSNSAPLLLKQERKRDDFGAQKQTLRYSRSQSDRYLAEIEAVEACKWLRAAGFPQYAQMYDDNQFPIDLGNVGKDHTNLEIDPLQSLYRRLCTLNRCATMRLDNAHKTQTKQIEESDDENFALSENWTFQPHNRRWSRIAETHPEPNMGPEKTESSSKESSPERFEERFIIERTLPPISSESSQNESDPAVRLRRSGSERIKDGAKAFLRRVESIKSRRRKRQNREGVVISGPHILDLTDTPTADTNFFSKCKSALKIDPNLLSPLRTPTSSTNGQFFSNTMPHLKEGKSDDSSSYYSDSQESYSGRQVAVRRQPSRSRRSAHRSAKVEDVDICSDSEFQIQQRMSSKARDAGIVEIKCKPVTRGGSLNLGKESSKHRDELKSRSFRSRTCTRKGQKTSESDSESIKIRRSPVVRWHSFQESQRPQMTYRKSAVPSKSITDRTHGGMELAAMSCGQLQIIRKLALVTLTGHMERYCPTHRSGWNWELPKFIKKIKMPDYKDKKVFGVPLALMLQRTGQTLPIGIRAAFKWLQLNALDQIGIFRKSGVKSRISKLKEQIETAETVSECMDIFDTQQAYDVADMLKQYFRDLPESLLTTKMSETFSAIFQNLPTDVRPDAVQSAVLLLPDENREVLFALLEFLMTVANNSQYNQMTVNNLAVCLAPTLFHSSIPNGTSPAVSTPRRRKTTGLSEGKEFDEAKASNECLAFMISNYTHIFMASAEKIAKCNFGYMEESKPVPLEALGDGMQYENWRGYLYESTSATIKEGREKSRGWISISSLDPNVEIAYKKVGDGHPLRLWRCVTEIEAPPCEVMWLLKSRGTWDASLLQCQIVKELDERTEIVQYTLDGQKPTDFCVLRACQLGLPRGANVIVETSIDTPQAKPVFGSVRGIVLASRYLIEPCGSGRSRLMHLARVDIKGKTPEWYNKNYGHICSQYLSRIRKAFHHVADVPESKV